MVIHTATGGEALILLMYTNYFDGTVSIGESVLHFEKASKFHGYNFQIKNSTDVVLSGWILLSINEHGYTLIIPQNCNMCCYLKVICVSNFLFFQSVKRLEISSFISILLTPKIAVQIK